MLVCFYCVVRSDIYVIFLIYQDRFLAYGPEQHPIVLQIGGNNLENLAKATQLATPYGYDEINFKYVLLFLSKIEVSRFYSDP